MNDVIRLALSDFSKRMPRVVREHEVLRVCGWLRKDNATEAAKKAINEVLKWAQKRCGGRLPPEAWNHESFEYLSGGRNSSCIRLTSGNSDIWAIRADDPDKNIAERVWTTEVIVGLYPNQPAKFSARLLVSTPEAELLIEPHTPGFIQQVAETCDLYRRQYQLSAEPIFVESSYDAEQLIDELLDPKRELPIFVVTLPSSSQPSHQSLDTNSLSRALLGIARVAIVNPEAAWGLSERFGRFRSVFGGAARVYLPGFSEDSDPYLHRLVLADQITTPEGAARCARWVRLLAARESVRNTRLGKDVLTFSEIRNASLQLQQTVLENEGANDTQQLEAAKSRINALESDLEQQKAAQDYYINEYEQERQRAEHAERRAQSSAHRIQELTNLLKKRGDDPDKNLIMPKSWTEIPDWCEEHLSGRLVLTANAHRGIKKAEYQNAESVARCLLWLANECREARISGNGGSINNVSISAGIQHASCGSDTYEFEWSGRRFLADWHVKSGGNTRDPSRCLRIYYCFDEQTQQIIVSDMPAHRCTNAS